MSTKMDVQAKHMSLSCSAPLTCFILGYGGVGAPRVLLSEAGRSPCSTRVVALIDACGRNYFLRSIAAVFDHGSPSTSTSVNPKVHFVGPDSDDDAILFHLGDVALAASGA